MSETQDTTPTWIWYELMTSDSTGALGFYAPLLGWTSEPFPDPSMEYTVINTPGGGLGGISPQAAEAKAMGAPPAWVGVVAVSDADAIARRCGELGGATYAGPFDIPTIGRYAVLADPTGGVFSVLAPTGSGPPPSNHELGRVSWNELWSSDPEAAFRFYAELFGWVETGSMDMGPQGTYRMYGVPGAGSSLGGMAMKMPDQPVSAWCFYFNVASADDSAGSVTAAGGKLVFGPNEVPGGGRMAMAIDPQGAVFALYSHGAPAA